MSAPENPAAFPQKMPEGMQIWPLGRGIVVDTIAVSEGRGLFFLAGVPDSMLGEPGDAFPSDDPTATMASLMTTLGNQSAVLVYEDVSAIERTIARLRELADVMLTARKGPQS